MRSPFALLHARKDLGPKHVVEQGKTPVLASEEACQLLDRVDVSTPARPGADRADGLHLRPDRGCHGHAGRGRARSEPA